MAKDELQKEDGHYFLMGKIFQFLEDILRVFKRDIGEEIVLIAFKE